LPSVAVNCESTRNGPLAPGSQLAVVDGPADGVGAVVPPVPADEGDDSPDDETPDDESPGGSDDEDSPARPRSRTR